MRILVPSWLRPGGWLDNLGLARSLGWASGMELLVLSFEGGDRELFLRESRLLEAEARDLDLGVHLPDPLLPGHREIVEASARYANYYVVHPPRLDASWGPSRVAAVIGDFAALVGGLEAGRGKPFLLEYTNAGDFAAAEAALPAMGLCADTAHLLADGIGPAAWMEARLDRLGEVHLNAWEGGRAHRVPRGDEPWLRDLLPILERPGLRVELEVFSLAAVEACHQVLEEIR